MSKKKETIPVNCLRILIGVFLLGLPGCDAGKQATVEEPAPAPYRLSDFEPSRACSTCHPQYYEEWVGSMHHYSSNDPIWMLAANSLQNSTGGRLNKWCWQCHAPIAFVTGNAKATFRLEELPDIVREGVNCDFCHVMVPPHGTTNQNIRYNIKPGRTKFGSIADPVPTSAHASAYDITFTRSEKCRECHDLIVNNVPVEITFTEWQNSAWGAMSVECQHCHMPRYTGRAAVDGPIRDNLHRHDFVGVDVAITPFPYKAEQRAMADSLLKNAACMSIQAPSTARVQDSITVQVRVCNDRTGHNLPTSVFFFRQMWIEVTIGDATGIVYRSGDLDANGDLKDKYSELEPNADRDLRLFGGTLYKHGAESNVFELDSLVNNSIPPFESRMAYYKFKAPRPGTWNVKVRLLFRPFAPYLFRALGAHQYLPELPIFEMITQQTTINVQP